MLLTPVKLMSQSHAACGDAFLPLPQTQVDLTLATSHSQVSRQPSQSQKGDKAFQILILLRLQKPGRMEACMVKPEVKKKPKLPKPLPKPTEIKRNDPEKWEKPTPLVPERPTDAELIQTQYRMKRATNEANGNVTQTPVVPPRPTEKEREAATKYSQHRRTLNRYYR
ncbi:uncharacterized protein PEZ65_012541 [Lycodopsis pacificus]